MTLDRLRGRVVKPKLVVNTGLAPHATGPPVAAATRAKDRRHGLDGERLAHERQRRRAARRPAGRAAYASAASVRLSPAPWASAASRNLSRSPSSTACGLPLSTPVRRSFTIL